MANKSVFASIKGRLLPATSTQNAAGAPAYRYSDAHALAQVAMTGTFGTTYYQDPMQELTRTLELANKVDPSFLAQTAVYTRKFGHMKDMPALLLAVLAARDPILFCTVFGRVVDNGKMLRTFVQIMRSGQTGRKSPGSAPKRMVANWLNEASDRAILQANVGRDPSLADVIKMVHPKPGNPAREALFAWIVGRPCDVALLPVAVQDFLRFKETDKGAVPDVPFQMLTQLPLFTKQWSKIAENASWQMTRMNLNTFQRHGVLAVPEMRAHIAATLRDPEQIAKARVFPYQLMTAYQALSADMPVEIRDALHDAMELSVRNVPKLHGQVVVCLDVSGSMSGAVTGFRKGATTVTRFVDVAGLASAAILRRNPSATVLPFEVKVLRHTPEKLGLTLDVNGWVETKVLRAALEETGLPVTPEQLHTIVATNDKKRFTLDSGGARMRAAQGHSVAVDLDVAPRVPPETLYHSTAVQNLASIMQDGLQPQKRQ